MNLIANIVEPATLLLTWKGMSGGRRLAVAQLEKLGDERARLTYLFPTTAAAKKIGFFGYPAFPITKKNYEHDVLDIFMRRLPPRGRTDFQDYLTQLRLSPNVSISSFALLGYSGARLPGDSFEIVHTFESANIPFEFVTEVAGARYANTSNFVGVEPGSTISLEHEVSNHDDPWAVRVIANGKKIGYINRYQTQVVHKFLRIGAIYATVDRISLFDTPSVSLFLRFRQL